MLFLCDFDGFRLIQKFIDEINENLIFLRRNSNVSEK